jgi:hypothetical protein
MVDGGGKAPRVLQGGYLGLDMVRRVQGKRWSGNSTWSVALPFCTRMLWPEPSNLPSALTRAAPMGTPPSSEPFWASSKAALKPTSDSDMSGGLCRKSSLRKEVSMMYRLTWDDLDCTSY